MTREELINRLIAWENVLERCWDESMLKEQAELHFALWWYGGSTDVLKPAPTWPGPDYVASKTTGRPRYLHDIKLAFSLIPGDVNWVFGKGRLSEGEPLYGVRIFHRPDAIHAGADDLIAQAESNSGPLAICIAAMRARIALSGGDR